MGPQNSHDGNYPFTLIKHFRALLDNMQGTTDHVAIFNSNWRVITHMSCNMTYILDEQMHVMEFFIYHGIQVQVEGIDGAYISQVSRGTGSQS
jgi:hypothetical protein